MLPRRRLCGIVRQSAILYRWLNCKPSSRIPIPRSGGRAAPRRPWETMSVLPPLRPTQIFYRPDNNNKHIKGTCSISRRPLHRRRMPPKDTIIQHPAKRHSSDTRAVDRVRIISPEVLAQQDMDIAR